LRFTGVLSGVLAHHLWMGRRKGEIDSDLEPPVPLRKHQGRPPDPDRKCPTEQRDCKRHGLTEFARYGQARPRWRCKRCVGEAVTRRLQKVKRRLVEDAGGCCCVCGYDGCMSNLHFHHVNPKKKSFPMTVAMGKSLATLRKEAEKCVLVCANCHGEIESGLIPCPPLGATYATWGALGRGQRRRAA
jgi:hypothetical protein